LEPALVFSEEGTEDSSISKYPRSLSKMHPLFSQPNPIPSLVLKRVLTQSEALLDLLEQVHLLFAGELVLGAHEQLVGLQGQDLGGLLGGGGHGVVELLHLLQMLQVLLVLVVLLLRVEVQVRVAALHIVGWYIR